MLGRKAAIGGLLMVMARLIARVVDLVTMLVLARLLVPTDFGLVAIAISVVSVLEAALDMPVNQALVRLTTITGAQYDTAFTLSLMRGALLTTVLIVAALPFANFYGDQRLVLLVCVLSIAPTARGLVSPRLAEYQNKLSYWRDFALELGGKALAFAVGVTTAALTDSYWALAAGVVTFPLASTIGSYILAPYRPRLSLSELPLFTGFVGWLSLSQIIGALNWQFERLLLGKLTTTARVGLFTTSTDIASIPFLAFFGPLLRPLLAAFSHLRDDPKRLGQSYLSASTAIVAIGLPLLVGECLVADPAVRLVLGDKWLGAIPLMQWLALSLIPALLALPMAPLIMAFGHTRLFVYRNLIELGVKLPIAIVGAIHYGFAGIIVARFVSELVASSYAIIVVKRLTTLSASAQLLGSWRSAAATCAMAPPVMLCTHLIGDIAGPAQAALALAINGTVGATTYAVVVWVLWIAAGRPPGVEAFAMNALANIAAKWGLARWLAWAYEPPPQARQP